MSTRRDSEIWNAKSLSTIRVGETITQQELLGYKFKQASLTLVWEIEKWNPTVQICLLHSKINNKQSALTTEG